MALEGAGRIGVGRQLIPVGMGMYIMPRREHRFYPRTVGRVGRRMINGVVLFPLIVGCFHARYLIRGMTADRGVFRGFVSKEHKQYPH